MLAGAIVVDRRGLLAIPVELSPRLHIEATGNDFVILSVLGLKVPPNTACGFRYAGQFEQDLLPRLR